MSDTEEMFDRVVRLLDREDQLINSRMTWYLTIQGFLVASAAVVLAGDSKVYVHLQNSLITALPVLGISISLIVYIAIRRARVNKKYVGKFWRNTDSGVANFPDPSGVDSWWSIFTPGQTIPIVFAAFWMAMIIRLPI